MRNCDYYEELISRSLDDELSVEERKALAVHLACCPSCSQMRQLMADISGLMEEDMEELPDGLHEDIMAAVRRSEMIKKNSRVGKSDKARGNRKIKISRPVRNLLATAACMALVIAAAVSLNPGERAESVVMARSAPDAAAASVQQDTATGTAPASTEQPVSTAQPSPTPTAQSNVNEASDSQITVQPGNQGSIITTPAPTEDPYSGWRKPSYPETTTAPSGSGQNYTIINPATPSPAVISAPTPTPIPESTPAQSQQTEIPAQQPESVNENQETNASAVNDGAAESGQIQEPETTPEPEIFGEIHKAAPSRVFSMFPSLSELNPTESPAPQNGESGESLGTVSDAESPEGNNALPQTSTASCPDAVELDLMDNEKGRDLLLMLMGMQDENGTPPDEALLPETDCDGSYVIALVFDEIPCEITVAVYGEDIYFSLAEIIIEPSADALPPETTAGLPAVTEQPVAAENGESTAAVSNNGENNSQPENYDSCDDFEPIWFKAECSYADFTTMLESLTK